MVSSSSASQSVDKTEGGLREELLEVVVEIENDEGFRTTITLRKSDLRWPSLGALRRLKPIEHSGCRAGGCVDARLTGEECS